MSILAWPNDYLMSTGFLFSLEDAMEKRMQKRQVKPARTAASVCWFDVPADDLGRAKKFYGSLFGWKFAKLSAAVADYWHIDTGGKDASPDGGLLPRMHPGHTITVYVTVPSIDKAVAKVQKLGGTVCKQKTAVPHMGYFVICEDTEHNAFALWEMNQRAA
jgi:predicted enzyme related to lactoylglutathione lyase